jgi:hypothetical protein
VTLTVDVQVPLRSWSDEPSPAEGLPPRAGAYTGLDVLLEDPVFAEWATETATRYQVSALVALGALSQALARDASSIHQVTYRVPRR